MLCVVLDVTGGHLGLDLFAARIPVRLDLLASLLCVCGGGGGGLLALPCVWVWLLPWCVGVGGGGGLGTHSHREFGW